MLKDQICQAKILEFVAAAAYLLQDTRYRLDYMCGDRNRLVYVYNDCCDKNQYLLLVS